MSRAMIMFQDPTRSQGGSSLKRVRSMLTWCHVSQSTRNKMTESNT